MLPARNPVFTGREGVLQEIERCLAAGPVAVVAVRGLGGVGKSQVALEYAYRMRGSGRYQVTGWVRADSPVTIAEDLAALAPHLGLSADGPPGEVAAKVVAKLSSRRDCLVVFDNAQDSNDLAGTLPAGGADVLITSRDRAWSGVAELVDLEVFTRPESVAFLCERTGCAEPDTAGELAAELGDLPLALAQAAAYIDARAMTVGGYLDLYRDPSVARRLRAEGLESGEYPESVARTWLLHFDRLDQERPSAVDLLRLCSFLDPDDIDLDLLTQGAAVAGEVLAVALADPLERVETVGALARASLVTAPAQGRLRVHRLVQAVTRDQLDEYQTAEWVKRALALIGAILSPEDPADYRSWSTYARLASHIEATAAHASVYPYLAGKIRLVRRLGIYLASSEQLRAARTSLERALAITEAAYGPKHLEVAKALDNLGAVQLQLEEFGDARVSIERALGIFQATCGPDDPEVAKALDNLSIAQRQLGELGDARVSIERALAIFQAACGPDDPEVAKALDYLSIAQRQLGEFVDARASSERALAISEAVYGPDHPAVASSLNNLGIVQLQLRERRSARASLERALRIFQAAYGPDNPEVAETLISLGAVQLRMRKLRDARASLERALGIFQAAYGPDHREVAKTITNLEIFQHRKIISYVFFLALVRVSPRLKSGRSAARPRP